MLLTFWNELTFHQAFMLTTLFVFMFFMFRDLRYVIWKAICFGAAVTALVWVVAHVGVLP